MKTRIIEHLGQSDILLPSLIAEALAANDRAKLRMSVLQAAAQHARRPGGPAPDLAAEARAAGLDPQGLRGLVLGARSGPGEVVAAPGLDRLKAGLVADGEAMIAPIAAADPAAGAAATARLARVSVDLAAPGPDQIALAAIAHLTAAPHDPDDDTLHRLVMDLHREINRLAAACAEETVAGARAHGLADADRPLVEAFMCGVESTRGLKFDHPGLDTLATRVGERLVLQNDIGTTDAHVLVVAVTRDEVTVTYSDVHRPRAQFFTGLLDGFPVRWSGLEPARAAGLGEGAAFYLVTGRLAGDPAAQAAFLEALGASLVFLIDWNRARKILRTLLGKGDAVRVLERAARMRVGHRAFLELGGAELIAAAVRHAAPTRIGFGERLDDVLGRAAALDFVVGVLAIATETLREGRSLRLANNAVEAELARHLDRSDSQLLAVAVRQAGLAREIAARIAADLAERIAGRPGQGTALTAHARRIEVKADRIAVEARAAARRLNAGETIARLVDTVEEAIDELEQAAFLASLIDRGTDTAVLRELASLCDAVVGAAEAAAIGIDAAADVPEGRRADSDDALAAASRLVELEHDCDATERTLTALVLRGEGPARALIGALELARALERASDRLAAAGHLVRTHVLAHLSA
ncbi:hypothetical protein PQJ75_29600 [Rhodoplanes sp. TEM]|uniref:Phosphate transport regulator n=1 Tax=Rhodoplanes tepidamans TaxID=200616 RepID=A0ABT5JJA7_RHOTP|nr:MULTISPECIES: hypothetical protein [Rhodoplanes]MDC7789686.1 hypothetical protein [Rhodoplanes tepidamans]MDC7987909.1 hypothetical protein [Rhodoplanes sp. TEM]MDQ0359198.1 uncharacterized protein Yka (UPF0111/DUF47 family) [Rhodoplanes tepidamans]